MRVRRLGAMRVLAALVVVAASLVTFSSVAGAQTPSVSLEQCRNGAVNTPASCAGANWVSGNAGASNSHWREGEFIAYRATIGNIAAGVHTLTLRFDTVQKKRHAIDYLGTYDYTETTSPTPTTHDGTVIHANNANPCGDLNSAFPWTCTPNVPTAFKNFPLVTMTGTHPEQGCATSTGTWSGTQVPGAISLFGPPGSAVTSVTYPSQNTESSNVCTTTVQVTFSVSSAISSSQTIVLAWGGHIASALDWGAGNSASSISGSPYHMAVVTLDGKGGSQDRSMSSDAIFFTPTLSTTVYAGTTPVSGIVNLGSTVHDTATLATASPTAGGTVTYNLYGNGSCTGTPTTTETVTVTATAVPDSTPFTPSVGTYSYQAVYSGTGTDLAATSICEPFAVVQELVTVSTQVIVATTTPPATVTTHPVVLGDRVYDTATVSHTGAPVTTGSVTYTFYKSGDCTTGSVVGTPQTVTLTATGVPDSDPTGALTGATSPYAYKATYSGSENYLGGESECEPFEVAPAQAQVATVVYDATTKSPVTSVVSGDSVYDTATVTGLTGGPVPTGTVTYTFYKNGDCRTGTVAGTETVTLSATGAVPDSLPTAPLTVATGPYAYRALYSGDGNYLEGSSECETFAVTHAEVSVGTVVYDEATGQPATIPIAFGGSVYDTATVVHSAGGPVPTGTVTYTFYKNGDCRTGTVAGTETVTLSATGAVPDSQATGALYPVSGHYAYRATYSGDTEYEPGASDCQPFDVEKAPLTVTTVVHDAATHQPIASAVATGTSVYDTAGLSGHSHPTPTGRVIYTFYSNGACTTGTVVGTETVTLATGAVPDSKNHGPLGVGTSPYAFRAEYEGDANYVTGSSECEPFEVVKEPHMTTIATKLSASTVQAGHPVTDAATLSGATPTAGGTVTYTVYGGNVCKDVATEVGTVTVTNGAVPDSPPVWLIATGTYYFVASYSGDPENTPSRSDCAAEALTVKPVVPTGPAPTGRAFGGDGGILLGGVLLVTLGAGFGIVAAVSRRRRRAS